MTTQLDQARENIGYCPQFDALLENLTAKEHLYLYAAIKGIPYDLVLHLHFFGHHVLFIFSIREKIWLKKKLSK